MSLTPTTIELLARARVDLRMGVPVVLTDGDTAALAMAVESLRDDRWKDFLALGNASLALTTRRAGTLKARVYDGDVARIEISGQTDLKRLQALADPADDLNTPDERPSQKLARRLCRLAQAGHRLDQIRTPVASCRLDAHCSAGGIRHVSRADCSVPLSVRTTHQ